MTGTRGELEDRALIAVLSYATEDMRGLGRDDSIPVASEDEARRTLVELLADLGGSAPADPDDLLATPDEVRVAALRVLDLLRSDPDVGSSVERLVAAPPEDSQMSVESAAATAVVLGALITWLQTKVSLTIRRGPDGTHVDFEVLKRSADAATLRMVVDATAQALGLPRTDSRP